ncbi:glycine N-methyltransferase [Rhinolophus ferrumequinum]|uniref:Glycine N-methyltransferase n=1 Tax=Rhinolophus ferrumequinum TaxID=59479 RepID=A0A7J7YRR3_RHIFE|nr:glycine N-methyltransferase [Rhinolophus ferrumequinum]
MQGWWSLSQESGRMVDSVYRTRSLGVAAEGLPDQYADGEAARVWQLYIGDTRSRTAEYKSWLLGLLHKHGCQRVLDVACGTGVDSIMLVEEGFSVTSVDASDKMLKYALKERWNRRHEPAFDKWVIEEANWMTLDKDVPQPPGGGFDAVICLGNSFAHLPDCKVNNKAHMVTLDYTVQVPGAGQDGSPGLSKFRLSYYPHCLASFTDLLRAAFGGKCQHSILGDFKPYKPGQSSIPCYFIHVLQRTG